MSEVGLIGSREVAGSGEGLVAVEVSGSIGGELVFDKAYHDEVVPFLATVLKIGINICIRDLGDE